jgi:hypothetical protein
MNERIKELALQLGPVATIGNWGRVEWADNIYPQLGDEMYAAIDLEKFAELIIQKCMACSTWVGKNNTNTVEPMHTAQAINQRIKNQFGVAEREQ